MSTWGKSIVSYFLNDAGTESFKYDQERWKKTFKGAPCKRNEFQGYDKFIEEGEKEFFKNQNNGIHDQK